MTDKAKEEIAMELRRKTIDYAGNVSVDVNNILEIALGGMYCGSCVNNDEKTPLACEECHWTCVADSEMNDEWTKTNYNNGSL